LLYIPVMDSNRPTAVCGIHTSWNAYY